jgi:hypothetical protein
LFDCELSEKTSRELGDFMALLYIKPAVARTKTIPAGALNGVMAEPDILPEIFLVECRETTK